MHINNKRGYMEDIKLNTNIKELTFDERIDEIARLIAGNNITEKTIEHAHEIIELAQLN